MESRPNRMPRFLIPLLLVVAVLAGWAWYKQREQPTPAATAPVAADSASAALPAATAGSNATRPGMPGAQGGLTATDARSLLGGPQTAADRAKALAERDRQMAEFERSHRAEPIDAAWASKAQANLDEIVVSEAIVASGIKPGEYKADCRSATCRVSAEFKSSGDAEDWGTFFLASSGETIRQAKMTIIQNPDGTSEVRIYGVRR